MKKICIFLIMVICLNVNVFAADASITLNVSVNSMTNEVQIKGLTTDVSPNNYVSLLISYPNKSIDNLDISDVDSILGTLNRIKQKKIDADGSFDFSYTLPQGSPIGWYKIKLNITNHYAPIEREFYLSNSAEIQQAVTEFNNVITTTSDLNYVKKVGNIINLYKHIYGLTIDKTYLDLSVADKGRLFAMINKFKNEEIGSFTTTIEINNLFNRSMAIVLLNNASQENIGKCLVLYNEYYGVDLNAEFKKLTNTYKNQLYSRLEKQAFVSVKEIKDFFNEQVIVSLVNQAERDTVVGIIADVKDVVGLPMGSGSDFDKLINNSSIYIALANKNDFLSFVEIKNMFDDEVEKARINESNTDIPKDTRGSSGNANNKVAFSGNNPIDSVVNPPIVNNGDENIFTDLYDVTWAKKSIEELYKKGVISGVGDKQFKPNNSITREEYVKILIGGLGLLDKTAKAEFSDVDASDWYYEYLASAVKSNIITGRGDGSFGVGEYITRQDMVVLTYRTLAAIGKTAPKLNETAIFSDSDVISDYAMEAVKKMQEANIVNGMGDNSFRPYDVATRAMAAKVVYSLILMLD